MKSEYLPRNRNLNSHSRALRNNSTKQENRLWYDFLKKHPMRFNRQRIIGEYIVDFHCPKANLIIELDGSQHYEEGAFEYDKRRTAYFESLGLAVIRFTNTDIDRNFDGVCQMIEQAILSHLRWQLLLKEALYKEKELWPRITWRWERSPASTG